MEHKRSTTSTEQPELHGIVIKNPLQYNSCNLPCQGSIAKWTTVSIVTIVMPSFQFTAWRHAIFNVISCVI